MKSYRTRTRLQSRTAQNVKDTLLYNNAVGFLAVLMLVAPLYAMMRTRPVEPDYEPVAETQPQHSNAPAYLPQPKQYSLAEAEEAQRAITAPGYTDIKNQCSKFVRQVADKSQNHLFRKYFGASANETGTNFLHSPYGWHWHERHEHGGIQPGDILVKIFKPYGHIGIYVGVIRGRQLVAENSSTSIGRVAGARGYRTLSQFAGSHGIDVIVRLPDPVKAQPKVLIAKVTPKPASAKSVKKVTPVRVVANPTPKPQPVVALVSQPAKSQPARSASRTRSASRIGAACVVSIMILILLFEAARIALRIRKKARDA
jgi:hypothetical protein